MDPDAAVAAIRQGLADRDNATTQAAHDIAEMNVCDATEGLLDWLAAGGFAPDWTEHPRKDHA